MNKTVLITGSSRGIGKETALYLAKNGFDIVLHCNKNVEKLTDVKKEIEETGQNARILQFDISDRKKCQNVLEKDIQENGAYYGVVLNAGINKDNPFPMLEDSEWDDVINTNLTGFYNVLKPVCMPMIQNRKGGRIVAMTSISGLTGNRGQVNYSASKAGIIGAVKALSRELAKRKITVNCVAPGIIESDMTKDIPDEIISTLIPLKRMGTPKEVASLINYLFAEDASYITGQVISVNGGMYL
ncbi:MAG: 3-oxoacyl-ACP reductase FabG [Candidatus Gastranaerophilales bacterium]|nr:3-oxoacyl-ACP reductase FabG [Candidatus Gastranaerophilales bacterium]